MAAKETRERMDGVGHCRDDSTVQRLVTEDLGVREADVEGPPLGSARGDLFGSFGHRDYRYFFFGALISNVGTWMQMVALGWLVYLLTDSSLSLGIVNFLQGIPVFVFILFAGAVADRQDRRKLLLWLQSAMLLQALAFGVLTSLELISMPWVYVLTLAGGMFTAFMFPAWQAMVPDLVPRRMLLNAIALNSAQFNGARLLGPMLGAAVFARFGVAEVFYVNAATFLFVIWALVVIRPVQELHRADGEAALAAVATGLRYARHHRNVAMLLLTTAAVMMFGMPFMTLLPVVADRVLEAGSTGYSLLQASNGLGALSGALAVASMRPDVDRSRLVRLGVLVMGVSLLAFAGSRTFLVSAIALAVAGAGFMTAVSSANTSLQSTVPPQLRGRVLSLWVLSFMGLMPFGSLGAGALATTIGAPQTIGIGAVILTTFGALLALRPSLLTDDAPYAPEAEPQAVR